MKMKIMEAYVSIYIMKKAKAKRDWCNSYLA